MSTEDKNTPCPFCDTNMQQRMIGQNEYVYAIYDAYPVTRGHLLVIPIRHVRSIFETTEYELIALWEMVKEQKKRLRKEDNKITGFNIGVNDGVSAGQTILHCHIHVIPRREGDIDTPRGGVRGVIPERRIY